MSDKTLRDYMDYGFPDPEYTGILDCRNEVCRMCGVWVVKRSRIGLCYFQLQGHWLKFQPSCDPRCRGSPIATIPICDICCESHKTVFDETKVVRILDHLFVVDKYYRMNLVR